MTNFSQRLITGSIFVAVMLSAIVFGPLSMQILFLVITVLALREFLMLIASDDIDPFLVPALVIGATVYILLSGLVVVQVATVAAVIIICASILFYLELFRRKKMPFHNIAYSLAGIIYIAIPFALIVRLSFITGDFDYIIPMGFFLILWSYDSFAYLFGKWLGKHRLFERISPKKSWEGFIGGLVMALVAAFIIYKTSNVLSLSNWLVVALIIAVCGTLGDLVESMLKRSLQKKDSGTILPGHGGLLDRFDAMLLSAPVVYAYLELAGVRT